MTVQITITHQPDQEPDKIVRVETLSVCDAAKSVAVLTTDIPMGESRDFYIHRHQSLNVSEIVKP